MKKKNTHKGYAWTGAYSWTKAKAEKRADKGRELGYALKVIPAKTARGKKQGYLLLAKTTPKGYGWSKKKGSKS